jgi:hypothetical protein
MHSAGARALRGDDNEMSREAVLLQWERKIEAAERRDTGGRFVRSEDSPEPVAEAVALHAAEVASEDTDAVASPRFERSQPIEQPEPAAERRTITITGQPTPARRRRPVVDAQLAQPDRIALWAFLLGLLLVAVAAGTAHA